MAEYKISPTSERGKKWYNNWVWNEKINQQGPHVEKKTNRVPLFFPVGSLQSYEV